MTLIRACGRPICLPFCSLFGDMHGGVPLRDLVKAVHWCSPLLFWARPPWILSLTVCPWETQSLASQNPFDWATLRGSCLESLECGMLVRLAHPHDVHETSVLVALPPSESTALAPYSLRNCGARTCTRYARPEEP